MTFYERNCTDQMLTYPSEARLMAFNLGKFAVWVSRHAAVFSSAFFFVQVRWVKVTKIVHLSQTGRANATLWMCMKSLHFTFPGMKQTYIIELNMSRRTKACLLTITGLNTIWKSKYCHVCENHTENSSILVQCTRWGTMYPIVYNDYGKWENGENPHKVDKYIS